MDRDSLSVVFNPRAVLAFLKLFECGLEVTQNIPS